MKRIIILSLFVAIFAIDVRAASEAGWQESARKAYDEGHYKEAIELYENELKVQKEKGLESADLYYNMGNAYFRTGEMAKARLNYERAQLIDPSDRDTRHNIEYLSTRIEDKIPTSNTFFLGNWFRSVQNLFVADTWTVVAIVCFIVFILCFAFFFLAKAVSMKKIVFYLGIVLLLLVVFANIFAYNQRSYLQNRNTAVIMVSVVSIVGSPDANSKEVFVLHSGTKVSILKEDRNWLQIEIDSGDTGWVQRDKIEKI